ncbi:hypothetical protein [Azospirillum sp. ST 5-10]|uniref:tetratricopeptide repeat protein n=1 Tax=unclassified Azospirillum TaxID=2630922 RepID=UPI003F49E1C0
MSQGQAVDAGSIDVEAWRTRIRVDVEANYHFRMGEAIERLEGNHDAAIAHLTACLERDPDHLLALGELIRVLEANGADARVWREKAQQRVPLFEAELALAQAADACDRGEFDAAEELARAARRLGADTGACTAVDAEILVGRAIEVSLDRKDEACRLLRTAADLRPGWTPPRRLLALQLEGSGREAEAMDLWRSILRADPEHGEANLKVGYDLYRSRQIEAALGHLRRAVAALPGDDFPLLYFGSALFFMDEIDEAIGVLQRCSDIDGANAAPSSYVLAVIRLTVGDMDGCVAACADAERRFGRDPSREAVAALAHMAAGRTAEAKAAIARAGEAPMVDLVRALIDIDTLEPDAALAEWRRLADVIPGPHARLVLAGLLADRGLTAEAAVELEAAKRLPSAPAALRQLGHIPTIARRLNLLPRSAKNGG